MGGSGDDFDPDRTSNFYQNIICCVTADQGQMNRDWWIMFVWMCMELTVSCIC